MKTMYVLLCISLLVTPGISNTMEKSNNQDKNDLFTNVSGLCWGDTELPNKEDNDYQETRSKSCPPDPRREAFKKSLSFKERSPFEQRWFNRQDIGQLNVTVEKLSNELETFKSKQDQTKNKIVAELTKRMCRAELEQKRLRKENEKLANQVAALTVMLGQLAKRVAQNNPTE